MSLQPVANRILLAGNQPFLALIDCFFNSFGNMSVEQLPLKIHSFLASDPQDLHNRPKSLDKNSFINFLLQFSASNLFHYKSINRRYKYSFDISLEFSSY